MLSAVAAIAFFDRGLAIASRCPGINGSRPWLCWLALPFFFGSLSSAQTIITIAGNGVRGFSGDGGPAINASLNSPFGVVVDAAGNLFIADNENRRVRKVAPAGTISTVAGNGISVFFGDGGPATSAALASPTGIAVDAAGNLYIADTLNHRVRRVTAGGIITTVAGNGLRGFAGDGGPATAAFLDEPYGVAVDTAGNLFIADSSNNRIRKVTTNGAISTLAGNGRYAYAGDGGPATNASLAFPNGVAVDAAGNVYIADTRNARVRKVSPNGIISTLAGNGSVFPFVGDGGPATSATVSAPYSVALDGSGNVFVADLQRIRKVSLGGTITTVAGNGNIGYSGDGGPATSASLGSQGVVVDAAGNVFIADQSNRVRKVVAPVPAPALNVGGTANGASFQVGPLAPGTIASQFGVNLSGDARLAGSLPLPTTLGQTSLLLNTRPVPLFFVSPEQINFQIPWELAGAAEVAVTVVVSGTSSAPASLRLAQFSPGIFAVNQGRQGAILISNSDVLAAPAGSVPGRAARPARRGEYVTIFCTGLGPVMNTPPSGSAAPTAPLAKVLNEPAVTIDSISAVITFAGLAPSYVGLYQVDVIVPENARAGDAIPVTLIVAGTVSNTATIAVQ
jgi:uncharacterized protein (TIGR03437 family)